jgi:hypothetical protein
MSFFAGCQTPAPSATSPQIPISKIQARFDGPGGSANQDFVNANNACRNETSHSAGNGTSSSPIIPTCDSVMQCLSGKGFYSAPYGKFDPEELKIGISCIAQ